MIRFIECCDLCGRPIGDSPVYRVNYGDIWDLRNRVYHVICPGSEMVNMTVYINGEEMKADIEG